MPLTVFLVGASNAVNLSDGLDGLAGGLAFLSFAGIAYLAYLSHETTVLVLAAGFLGGLLGFLRYNTYPARIFMGDAGSQLLGFSMGVLVLLLSDPARAPFPVTVGLLVLGLTVSRYDCRHGAAACEGPFALHRRPEPCPPQVAGSRTLAP
ncbi:MAG: undecaprenyl/decaprenyl-phosphate alpha-N-acetylglucosaminyl 1-phosphate transferase [Nitrospira sp.]|nr:undecaprenyl/decaprenyl-phosphate alpha-N-acetylglucosaminyl 1-phosphate transferase [Nitrospira sp.]